MLPPPSRTTTCRASGSLTRPQELEPPALDRLGDIMVPVLVLAGGLDLDAVHAAAARVVAGTAGARRVDWLDAGHLPALERPADFLDLLREWTAE